MNEEVERIRSRYARRGDATVCYSATMPSVYMIMQERQRALIELIRANLGVSRAAATVLEVGCGSGGNLLELIWLGFDPANLWGNELLDARAALARHRLPAATRISCGDAASMEIQKESLDIVYQSTVFSSILDTAFRESLAALMWSWIRPGGAVLWYDLAYDNPKNADVRGVPEREIAAMFRGAKVISRRVTLAPPIARLVTRVSPSLYTFVNRIPWLRTHRLCWIQKP